MNSGTYHSVRAWTIQGLLLEHHQYAPGPPEADTPHAHEAYQLCLSVNFPGFYAYRGASYAIPATSLSIIHPGEIHASRDPGARSTTSVFRLMYVPTNVLQELASTIAGRATSQPFFDDPVILQSQLASQFLEAHRSSETGPTRLERESLLLSVFTTLVCQHTQERPGSPALRSARPELQRVRDYLHSQYAAQLSLETLAQIAGYSAYHLCRLFRREFGVPPHVYQHQVRIDHAKRMLAAGQPSAEVARAIGFYDQSHFGRFFKRFVGVSPGQYTAL